MKRLSKVIKVGPVLIGGDNPVAVQSMTNTDTRDIPATLQQIAALEKQGCQLVRMAVVDMEAAAAVGEIKKFANIPIIADIHFDHRLALASAEAGADGLRINPGNIGSAAKVREVVAVCRERGIPIRVGVNAGSLDRELLRKYGQVCAEAMVESALYNIRILEDMNFDQIKVSLKASSVLTTMEAYRLIALEVSYPLHVGITEAGTTERALIKSALGIGTLLQEGIGDTIRVSLTSDPEEEVWAAYEILRTLGLSQRGAELLSCPTCGRCQIPLLQIAEEVDRYLRPLAQPIKVAVMGCAVNGPGEAREADIGIAGGKGLGLLFKKGRIIKKVPEEKLISVLLEEINQMISGQGG
ncbi:MAG: flavodoxin-dependent (E)-4-hydroxy-3-methylbut-2-enyl-diphosphate synthase [Syntrophomonadaceae bacterium]|jgi:(E)-4-hydroxy-3-methylbut-2-enyl-diphosphate synthase|nr:flavodoxin-dependent (E)-4-hydroxy-3-methylbut-2-enyl-diphosphate synthase [Syntrophomonadaceae bacterium]